MRHKLLLVAFVMMGLLPLKAQVFRVGLLGGVNMTDVDGMDPIDPDNDFHKFGFTAGGYVGLHLAESTKLQMEIAYSQKGSSSPPDSLRILPYYTFRLNYINVDLVLHHMTHINLGKKPTDKFGIEGGVSAGYLFKYYYSAQSVVYTQQLSLNSTDLSLFAGFTYNFTYNFCIDLRYYNSIFSIFQNTPNNTQWLYYGSWNRGHNLNFQITFKFSFGKDANAKDNSAQPAATPANQ